jgi:anti-sigma factor RsiW
MTCKKVREQFLDMTTVPYTGAPEIEAHLHACPACAAELASLRQTMALLDEWQAPEPSPYFDARLRARLREESAARPWYAWLRDVFSPVTLAGRRVALAGTVAALLLAGVFIYEGSHHVGAPTVTGPVLSDENLVHDRGTPVADLEILEKNEDLYANFDLLDDVPGTQVVQASQPVSQ